MKQTPAHDQYNHSLLTLMPMNLKHIVEVGCSSGALAKAYLSGNPDCKYTGLEIDTEYAALSRKVCTKVICNSIEQLDEDQFQSLFPSDCWVFGDVLEHLYDPWAVLARIRQYLGKDGQIIACIPNAQHWSVQARLNCGQFRYEDSGLMDRTHIRWFTRITMIELFQSTGYRVTEGIPRILPQEPTPEQKAAIAAMAKATGADPTAAANDCIPFQWLIRAVPDS